MQAIGKLVAMIFAAALVTGLGAGAYGAYRWIGALFAGLDRQVASVTGIACLAGLASAWLIARSVQAASRRTRAAALREEKTATYQLLLDFWTNCLQQPRSRTGQLPAELAGKLEVLERLLALYGGASVIRAHTAMRGLERERGSRDPAVQAQLGVVLIAIRDDLGTGSPRRFAGDLQRLLVASPDEAARLRTAPA